MSFALTSVKGTAAQLVRSSRWVGATNVNIQKQSIKNIIDDNDEN